MILSALDLENEWDEIQEIYGFKEARTGNHMMVEALLSRTTKEGVEFGLVGATGTNYGTTDELNVLNYEQAMNSLDKKEWENAIEV